MRFHVSWYDVRNMTSEKNRRSCFLYNDSDCIKTPDYFFKLTWVLMAIVILCVIAMVLYGILNMVEKRVRK